ncbi:MAG TPA: hypothetical protein VHW94_11895 [Candidatus Dormibacteraeota bacterium]|nr:hypothetical protein [Candidatus Dormibacteraeota bacterium]
MRSRRGPLIAGVVLGVATTAAYLIGSNRSFGYDAAATFANFVATSSLWDAFAVRPVIPTVALKSVASNDHVLLSLVSHLIYSATGSRSEIVYRLLPALAAGGTVGTMAAVLSRKFGLLAGVSASLYIATLPLFVDNGRDLRGYSLAALLSVFGSLVLAAERPIPARRIVYALVIGLAISAQLFAGAVLIAHVTWMASRRDAQLLIRWSPAWVAAALIGVAANANIQFMELVQHGYPASVFNPDFPRYLVLFLFGAPLVLPIGLWLSAAVLGLWPLRAEPWVWASVVVTVVVVAILWLGLQPAYLYPRFFIFLVPGCAFLMAAAIARWKVLAPVVLMGAAAAAAGQVYGYTEDPLALQRAAAYVDHAHAAGRTACVIHSDEQVLGAYTTNFKVVSSADQLSGCDAVVVVSWNVDLALRDQAAQQFPRRTILPAYYPAVVLER